MNLVSHNEDPLTAAEKAFGDLKQLQSEAGSIHSGQAITSSLFCRAPPRRLMNQSYKVRLLTQLSSMPRGQTCWLMSIANAEARTLVDAVLKEDPNNVQAHETMGYLEFRAGTRWTRRGNGMVRPSSSIRRLSGLLQLRFALHGRISRSPMIRDRRQSAHRHPAESAFRSGLRSGSRSLLAMRHEKLDEAHILSLQAIQLEPGISAFRVNAANVLMAMERFDDAITVLRGAEKVAKNPGEAEMVQNRIDDAERAKTAPSQR